VLAGAALDRLPLIEPEDALNAIGRVEARPDGPVVVVDQPGGIIQAGDPVAVGATGPETSTDPASTSAEPSAAAAPEADPGIRFAALGGGSWPAPPEVAGLGTLLAISAVSLVVTLLRREQSRRRLATRIAGRLATFATPSTPAAVAVLRGPADTPPTGGPAERGPRSDHSA
jgi:hypothetical protein